MIFSGFVSTLSRDNRGICSIVLFSLAPSDPSTFRKHGSRNLACNFARNLLRRKPVRLHRDYTSWEKKMGRSRARSSRQPRVFFFRGHERGRTYSFLSSPINHTPLQTLRRAENNQIDLSILRAIKFLPYSSSFPSARAPSRAPYTYARAYVRASKKSEKQFAA